MLLGHQGIERGQQAVMTVLAAQGVEVVVSSPDAFASGWTAS